MIVYEINMPYQLVIFMISSFVYRIIFPIVNIYKWKAVHYHFTFLNVKDANELFWYDLMLKYNLNTRTQTLLPSKILPKRFLERFRSRRKYRSLLYQKISSHTNSIIKFYDKSTNSCLFSSVTLI